jgi:acyl-CoA hydrolase
VDIRSDVLSVLGSSRRLVVADGAGAPFGALSSLFEVFTGEVFVGWCLGRGLESIEISATRPIRSFMGGNGARHLVTSPHFSYVPVRFSHLPRALATWLRPYTLLLSAAPQNGRWALTTEAGWIPAAVENADQIIVVPNEWLPRTTVLPPFNLTGAVVTEPSTTRPDRFTVDFIDDASRRIGEIVASLIPDDAAIQYGPGPIGAATLGALRRPARIRSGIVSDAVLEGVRSGTIIGTPCGSYAVGSDSFYDDIAERGWVDRVEVTHNHASLATDTFVAVNTALEIDLSGQVNVETIKGSIVAGLGGHADFAFAASSSRKGLSIVALPSRRGNNSTLVEQLDKHVTTQRSDIDMFVNEHGYVDVRGLSDEEKRRALFRLWDL